jgi:hypothetical protein
MRKITELKVNIAEYREAIGMALLQSGYTVSIVAKQRGDDVYQSYDYFIVISEELDLSEYK